MENEFNVLDKGKIKIIETMGTDQTVVNSARISYAKGTVKKSNNEQLINYLMKNKHHSPFEMCEIQMYVKLPLFVARQWVRHRASSFNEVSARYSIVDLEYYEPDEDVICFQSKSNKQGRGGRFKKGDSEEVREEIRRSSNLCFEKYNYLIDRGVSRELARIILPVNMYTEIVWKTDLRNLFNFLKLRADPRAQYEIRVYAEAIKKYVAEWVPLCYNAFKTYG